MPLDQTGFVSKHGSRGLGFTAFKMCCSIPQVCGIFQCVCVTHAVAVFPTSGVQAQIGDQSFKVQGLQALKL